MAGVEIKSIAKKISRSMRRRWKAIVKPSIISLVALLFSGYTFWDNYFNFKLNVSAGRQIKLWVGQEDKSAAVPVILMSLAFTNSGGRTECLQDVKLHVTLTSNNRILWQKEFVSMREYDTLLATGSTIRQVELLPIVIVGKTTEVRKYVFWPVDTVRPEQFPKSFDLTLVVYTEHRSKWRAKRTYEVRNVSGVWEDLSKTSGWNFAIRDIWQKK